MHKNNRRGKGAVIQRNLHDVDACAVDKYKSHFHVLDDEDDNDGKGIGEAPSFKVLILPAVLEMTKVFELSNSHTVGLGTNFVRLTHSLDFAGRLKAVSLPLVTAPRAAGNLGTPPPRSSKYLLALPHNYSGKELSPPTAGYCLRETITYMYIWH